ncbi:hypothetical protein HU200_051851 [Digitaria exilis]|uniref:Uncharacterized protein n=1 Tax=Digitaria exilis TaxID=1010633 RepID=A0A835APD7_9POAL|nr:hypothetical protein HU200_051851 [Digitaria exilis]
MALQSENLAAIYSPHVVARAFVKQYYEVLRYQRQNAHKFYGESSILSRSDPNGGMISATTIDDIDTQLQSKDFTNCLIELETVDSQPSNLNGVLILVAGYFIVDAVKEKFTQSFFLAPKGSGYFVLNDMLRLERPSGGVKEVKTNHDDGSTQSTTLPAEPETASIEESTAPNIPPTENIMPVNDEIISTSTNVASQVKNVAVVDTCKKVVNKDIEKIPEATPAPPSVEKEVTKKTYASIVKTVRETIPSAPAVKPKPNPRPQVAQNAEKSVSASSEPAQATSTAPQSDKNVSKNKPPDGPGYSVFVKNLPFDATVQMVEKEFSTFGAIKPGGIQVRKYQLDRFCFGFVEFETEQSMQAAIKASCVYFGSWESYVEEKRTKTRVVDGVVTRGDDNGSRFQSGRGGYHGDSYRGQGGFRNNGCYNDGGLRNDFRNQDSGRGRGPQGNGYPQNGNGYQQNRNGYHQNGNGNGYPQNGNQQRRPSSNGNGNGNGNGGKVERSNGPKQQPPVAS